MGSDGGLYTDRMTISIGVDILQLQLHLFILCY